MSAYASVQAEVPRQANALCSKEGGGGQCEGAGEDEGREEAAESGLNMQRDMELVRQILLTMEANAEGYAPSPFEIQSYSKEAVGFHVHLLHQAGLIDAHPTTSISDRTPQATPISITWAGYEFLASAKNEATWRKVTGSVMAKAGALGFELLRAALSAELKRQIGI